MTTLIASSLASKASLIVLLPTHDWWQTSSQYRTPQTGSWRYRSPHWVKLRDKGIQGDHPHPTTKLLLARAKLILILFLLSPVECRHVPITTTRQVTKTTDDGSIQLSCGAVRRPVTKRVPVPCTTLTMNTYLRAWDARTMRCYLTQKPSRHHEVPICLYRRTVRIGGACTLHPKERRQHRTGVHN
jgi:hypothetical protein